MSVDRSRDVPSRIDLRLQTDADQWVRDADAKRPWRQQLRAAIAELLNASNPRVRRVLELGPGPGLLAEQILKTCTIDSYTLFDFSQPMLNLSRARLGDHRAVTFMLGNFKEPGWTASVAGPYDAVVAMQAVHEIRHKRHVPRLYREIYDLLGAGGRLLVCDHVPPDSSERMTTLHSTQSEQHAALVEAGFVGVTTHVSVNGLYLCGGHRR